jgi:hypothetical protein
MTAADLLRHLQGRGVRLEAKEDRLRVDAPAGLLTEADRQALTTHKVELLALLMPPASITPTSEPADCKATVVAALIGTTADGVVRKDCMGLPDLRPPEVRQVCPYSSHKRFWTWTDHFEKTYRCALCHPPANRDDVERWEEFP